MTETPRVPNRLEVNAAIERLVRGEEDRWIEDARIVIRFGSLIAPSDPTQQGLILAFDGPAYVEESYIGRSLEQVGSYKVWHFPPENADEAGVVAFVDFKRFPPHANVLTAEDLSEYWLMYEPCKSEPYVFAKVRYARGSRKKTMLQRIVRKLRWRLVLLKHNMRLWFVRGRLVGQRENMRFTRVECTVVFSNDPDVQVGENLDF